MIIHIIYQVRYITTYFFSSWNCLANKVHATCFLRNNHMSKPGIVHANWVVIGHDTWPFSHQLTEMMAVHSQMWQETRWTLIRLPKGWLSAIMMWTTPDCPIVWTTNRLLLLLSYCNIGLSKGPRHLHNLLVQKTCWMYFISQAV